MFSLFPVCAFEQSTHTAYFLDVVDVISAVGSTAQGTQARVQWPVEITCFQSQAPADGGSHVSVCRICANVGSASIFSVIFVCA